MKYEFKKLLTFKVTWLVMGVFLISYIYCFYLASLRDKTFVMERSYLDFIEDINDTVTSSDRYRYLQDQITQADNIMLGNPSVLQNQTGKYSETAYGDYIYMTSALELEHYIRDSVYERRVNYIREAIYRMNDLQRHGLTDTYEYRANRQLIDYYNHTLFLRFANVGDTQYESYFRGAICEYILLFSIILWVIILQELDERRGMKDIVLSCAYRTKSVKQKWRATLLLSIGMMTVAYLFEIVAAVLYSNLNNVNLAVQMYEEWAGCPFALSIIGKILLVYVLRCVFVVLVVTICSFFVYTCKYSRLAGSICSLTILGGVFLGDALPEATGTFARRCYELYQCSPFVLLQPNKLLMYYNITNFWGYPVFRCSIAIVGAIALTIIFYVLMIAKNERMYA